MKLIRVSELCAIFPNPSVAPKCFRQGRLQQQQITEAHTHYSSTLLLPRAEASRDAINMVKTSLFTVKNMSFGLSKTVTKELSKLRISVHDLMMENGHYYSPALKKGGGGAI